MNDIAPKKTILIADDEEVLRKVMRMRFERSGYNVIDAHNGLDALEKFKQNPNIDLVITDNEMNSINGMRDSGESPVNGAEFVQALRKISNTVPVLLYCSPPTQQKYDQYRPNIDEYLDKGNQDITLIKAAESTLNTGRKPDGAQRRDFGTESRAKYAPHPNVAGNAAPINAELGKTLPPPSLS